MAKHDLAQIAAQQMQLAKGAEDGCSTQALVGIDEGLIQQTVVALAEGHSVAARDCAAHSTLQVLTGGVRVRTSAGLEDAAEGDLVEVPTQPHVIRAESDTTALLTEARSDAEGWDPHAR